MIVKNKLVYIMISILIIIALSGAATYYVFSQMSTPSEDKQPTIDEVIEYSVDVPEITTNLADGGYLKITFKIQTENKKAQAELAKRDFQIRDLVIGLLADMNSKDIAGQDGQNYLKQTLKDHLNELMQEGKVVNIYITNAVTSK